MSIVGLIQNWLAPLITGAAGALGVAYISGQKVQAVESTQKNQGDTLDDHKEIFARHAVEIENLRKAQNDANIAIAKLPTKDDLREVRGTMQVDLQAAVSQIGQMIAGQRAYSDARGYEQALKLIDRMEAARRADDT